MDNAWRIIAKESTVSTNLDARSGRPGEVYTALYQSGGRGRLDHKWLSPPGENLMMSAVLDVSSMDAEEAATLPLAVGLALIEALERFVKPLWIKWPNDIYDECGRKLAGILCERRGDAAIAGIGVNVAQKLFDPEIARSATSLSLHGVGISPEETMETVLSSLGAVCAEWRSQGFASIWPRIARRDFLKGRSVGVFAADGAEPSACGVCGGISKDGSLLVDGKSVWAGEVHVRFD